MENERQLNKNRHDVHALATPFRSGSTLAPTGGVNARRVAEKTPLLKAVSSVDGEEWESCIDEASTKPKWEQARPHSPQSIAAAPHSSNGFGSELYSFVDRESPASRHDAQSGTTLSTTSGMAQKPESAARQGELHGSESETLRQQRDEMDLQALKCGAQLAVSVAASGAGDPAAPQLPK